jgi:hypothetical protein
MLRPLLSLFLIALAAGAAESTAGNAAVQQLLERIGRQEENFAAALGSRSAMLETYIQELGDGEDDRVRDHYFLGRVDYVRGLNYTPLVARTETRTSRLPLLKSKASVFLPSGFAQMVLPDAEGFDRRRYRFDYVRREFLGEVRCLVFEVTPLDGKAVGRFIGRIWVEDREMYIVRFNGTYTHSAPSRLFFHFDSWRLHVADGVWVPAFIYVEETEPAAKSPKFPRFKAQSRIWGYDVRKGGKLDELASIAIEAEKAIQDPNAAAEATPLESQRSWERQAEANIVERLEKAGLLAPPGPVDEVLNTVVNNLIAGGKLSIEARGRVLLTTPLETFSVGQTIVISRGLIDVLPDEASLAMVLCGELAHMALGHRHDTSYAFSDRTMLSDAELLSRLRLGRPPEQIAAAGAKAVALLSESIYREKMGNAGLFLKALAGHGPQYPNLIRANLGNQLASAGGLVRMQQLAATGPALENQKLDQIAALPLGSRIRVDPWSNRITLLQSKPVALLSARDKLPFEVTPFMIPLSRVDTRAPGEEKPPPAPVQAAR